MPACSQPGRIGDILNTFRRARSPRLPARWPASTLGRISLAAGHRLGDNHPMPRTARAAVGGYCYHALNRGNERARVFHDAADYHDFVRLLREACARTPMRVVGYCVMPNHVHL